MDNILFSDKFIAKDVNRDGQRFDRVSRYHCTSENMEIALIIDINSELYPIKQNDAFSLILARSLMTEQQVAAIQQKSQAAKEASQSKLSTDTWNDIRKMKRSLADEYEYVMYGKGSH